MNRRDLLKNVLALSAVSLPLALLGTSHAAGDNLLRPPGALDERSFLSRCIRCARCVDACPNKAIVPLDASFGHARISTPAIQARRQACMLCNRVEGDYLLCTTACPTGALQPVRKDPAEIMARVSMGTAVIDQQLCYSYNNWSCGACYRACPLSGLAMTLGLWERPTVDPAHCIGCGLCERSCIRYPHAIRVQSHRGRAAS